MAVAPVLWVIWSLLVVITAALYLYRTSLTKDEDGQIFLDECFDHEKNAQAAIVAKVNRIQPYLRIAMVLAGVATLMVIAYYLIDVMNQFK
jgi:hypothetical protein